MFEPADAVVELAGDVQSRDASAGAEAPVVAEGAAPGGDRTIDIGARKSRVDADLLHPAAKPLAEDEAQAVVAESSRPPGRYLSGRNLSKWREN
jgi:hypothetical protein